MILPIGKTTIPIARIPFGWCFENQKTAKIKLDTTKKALY